jgi:hypothetical protein
MLGLRLLKHSPLLCAIGALVGFALAIYGRYWRHNEVCEGIGLVLFLLLGTAAGSLFGLICRKDWGYLLKKKCDCDYLYRTGAKYCSRCGDKKTSPEEIGNGSLYGPL